MSKMPKEPAAENPEELLNLKLNRTQKMGGRYPGGKWLPWLIF
jgi:hypothetical protein